MACRLHVYGLGVRVVTDVVAETVVVPNDRVKALTVAVLPVVTSRTASAVVKPDAAMPFTSWAWLISRTCTVATVTPASNIWLGTYAVIMGCQL